MTEARVHPAGVAGMGLLAFVIIGSYELARPAAESFFLATYGAERLPWVWLAVAATAAGVVALYNRFGAGKHLLRVMAVVALICAAVAAALLLALRAEVPGAAFALYVFKDVYVVVLIELFWTFANVVFPIKTARWIYGLFCVSGSGGGVVMGLLAGVFAGALSGGDGSEGAGTVATLWLLVPVLGLLAAMAAFGARVSPHVTRPAADDKPEPDFRAGFARVVRQRYLLLMLGLIALTQVVITLVDYQFNAGVQAFEPDTDARTALIGQVYAAINTGAIVLQLGTGVVLTFLGVPRVLGGIPGLLGLTLVAFLVSPHVYLLAAAKVMSKVLDYSLFRAAKELLYIPLDYDDKTQGKAVIDMLGYRAAKGGASVLLLGIGLLGAPTLVGWLTVGLLAGWLAIALALGRAYTRRRAAE